jgi:acylphosphatase
MKQSVILTIHGRVQGVGFRYFVRQKAELLNINGFVKNLAQGSVYVEAEGEPEQLQLFIKFCQQGPSHSWVEKAEIQYCPEQYFDGFKIR